LKEGRNTIMLAEVTLATTAPPHPTTMAEVPLATTHRTQQMLMDWPHPRIHGTTTMKKKGGKGTRRGKKRGTCKNN
tara:strand:+ start:213 stop:440 length:228 start_codon:yes stop_codon:yes gene_type:complete